MKKINILIFIFIFLITGEVVVRFDKKTNFLNHNEVNVIPIKIDDSKIKKAIDSNTFLFSPNQLRVLVLGDSYIYGGGIKQDEKFSKRLSNYIDKAKYSNEEIKILDISRAGNTTIDNFNFFQHYIESFNPHVIFWAYNFNDILGITDQVEIKKKVSGSEKLPQQSKRKIKPLKNFTKKVYNFSELIRFVSYTTQKELKIKGVVLPFGEFHYLVNMAYNENTNEWKRTKDIFDNAIEINEKNKTELIFYKMPEFNLLSYNSLFSKVDNSLLNYFQKNSNSNYIDGYNDFKNGGSDAYMISKHDGHPNERAHDVIAKRIGEEINRLMYLKE